MNFSRSFRKKKCICNSHFIPASSICFSRLLIPNLSLSIITPLTSTTPDCSCCWGCNRPWSRPMGHRRLAGQHYKGHGNSNLHEDQGQLEDEDEKVGVLLASCRKNGGQLYLILFYRGGSVKCSHASTLSKNLPGSIIVLLKSHGSNARCSCTQSHPHPG